MSEERTTVELGRLGETIAAAYLELQGYTIASRNARQGRGEVDLIATRGDLTCFVEVRLRRRGRYGTAVESVGRAKQERIKSAAREVLRAHAVRPSGALRCDVIAIDYARDGGLVLTHIVDALRQ